MISSPSELLAFLESIDARPKRSLSQNFLIDQNILDKIVLTAQVKEGETVLEIGAGPGALTETLLKKGAKVIAIEKDDKFAKALHRFQGLEIYHGDILQFPFEKLEAPVKVVANLPYHLTAPILGLLLQRHSLFSSLTLMVQDEVAKRMVASPNSSDYSSLTIFLNFYSTPRYAFKVKGRSFFPAPKVDSAIVTLEMKKEIPTLDPKNFFSFVKKGFQQRRKMLRSSLKELVSAKKIEEILQMMGKKGEERPENLSLPEWIEFYKHLSINCL